MLREPRGSNGFGYDPLFFCPAIGKTLAEATEDEKFKVSHRGNALRALFERLKTTGDD
jgi:XTP/dITP diphosphohydrolase